MLCAVCTRRLSKGWLSAVISSSLMKSRNIAASPLRPERPRRCRKLATLCGAVTWAIESTLPISIPNSRVIVQTAEVGKLSFWSRASSSSRISLERLPWWGKNSFGTPFFLQRSDRPTQNCSVRSRLLVKIRCDFPRKILYRSSTISSNVVGNSCWSWEALFR